jgi:diguanylate cyclase (GGDEF)-like protein/PAS domain S-box-containing protein
LVPDAQWNRSDAQTVLDTLSEGVVVQDADGVVRYANVAAERILGVAPGGLLGASVYDPEYAAQDEDGVEVPPSENPTTVARVRGETVVDRVMRVSRSDGARIWVSVNARPTIEDGRVTGVVCSFVDITELRHAREEATAAAHRIEAVLANQSDAVSVIDAAGEMTYVSPMTERLLGRDALRHGESIFDFVHADDRARATARFEDACRTPGLTEPFQVRVHHDDGTWRTLEVKTNNLLHDPAVAGVIVSSRDITERRRIESSLYEAQERFDRLFDTVAVGMAIVALDGSILRANPAFSRLVDHDLAELRAMDFYEFCSEEDVARIRKSQQRLIDGDFADYQMDQPLCRKDGTWIYARVVSTVVHDDEGNALYTVSQFTDITDHRDLTDRLEHAATHDHLTGLATRPLLDSKIEGLLSGRRRNDGDSAVLLVDLDDFKGVNDTYGHLTGDAVLLKTAQRLQSLVRSNDLVVRLGGDEFVVVLTSVGHPDRAIDIARRIVESIASPIYVGDERLRVSASVGVVIVEEHESADALLDDADRALYRAKHNGRGDYAVAS